MVQKISFLKNKFFGLFAGILMGFMVSALILFFSNTYTLPKAKTANSKIADTESSLLTISSPKDNLAVGLNTIQIKGKTKKGSLITITTTNEIQTLLADNSTFSAKLVLQEGLNKITINAFDLKTGENEVEVREVLYLEKELSEL